MTQNMKIMVVDDSLTMRKIITNFLNLLGYKMVVEAENGTDAFAKLAAETPAFILADWNFPGTSGVNFIRDVRNDERYKNIPILMLTNRGMKSDMLAATKVNVNSFITKPFTAQILKEKIQQVLN